MKPQNDSGDGWSAFEGDPSGALEMFGQPLDALASGAVPAIILRNAWSAEASRQLVTRLVADGLLHDPAQPVSETTLAEAIPEGYYREGAKSAPVSAWEPVSGEGRMRIDIGSSLGYRGSDQDAFLQHSEETHALFRKLFEGRDDPVRLLYDRLQDLAPSHRVETAHEPDGRKYGPAIIRAHYGGYTYRPHFDSVRLREKRENYAVHEFTHQFAGVLVLQNAYDDQRAAHAVLHRCLWDEEVDSHLRSGRFYEYARDEGIEHVEIALEPGDLYFFNTRLIHEVPGVAGPQPRVVLATFIGYSAEREEIFVWS